MKRIILLSAFVILCIFLRAQPRPYNVVFDITSKDTIDHRMLIRWLSAIIEEGPKAKLETVFFGQSLDMVTKGKSVVANDIEQLAKNENVTFKVCRIAMKRHNIDSSQLVTGTGIVPDGIYEVISKQMEGWGYIKAVH